MFVQSELSTIYARNPFLSGYLSTMLEDLQISENEEAFSEGRDARDVGTIYTVPAETFGRALADCESFVRVADREWAFTNALTLREPEQLGHDFHLTRTGAGTGFWDRAELNVEGETVANIGAALTTASELYRNEGGYIGDDGRVYLA